MMIEISIWKCRVVGILYRLSLDLCTHKSLHFCVVNPSEIFSFNSFKDWDVVAFSLLIRGTKNSPGNRIGCLYCISAGVTLKSCFTAERMPRSRSTKISVREVHFLYKIELNRANRKIISRTTNFYINLIKNYLF